MKFRFWSSGWLAGQPITIVVALLAGSLPLKADLMPGSISKITNNEAAEIRTIRAEIPQTLTAGINRTSPTNLKLRYRGDAEIADALKLLLQA